MKRSLLIYLFILLVGTVNAQVQSMRSQDGSFNSRDRFGNQVDPSRQPQNLNDSVDIQSLPPQMYMWRLEALLPKMTAT